MRAQRQIVTFGGGGLSMEAGNPLLDEFVLELTGRSRPRVCFLPQASGDADHYIVAAIDEPVAELAELRRTRAARVARAPGPTRPEGALYTPATSAATAYRTQASSARAVSSTIVSPPMKSCMASLSDPSPFRAQPRWSVTRTTSRTPSP